MLQASGWVFLRSEREASSTVTIELPSPDQLSAGSFNIYVCAPHARTSPCSPKSLCSVEAMLIVFTPSRPRIAPFFVADEVLARDNSQSFGEGQGLSTEQEFLFTVLFFAGMWPQRFAGFNGHKLSLVIESSYPL